MTATNPDDRKRQRAQRNFRWLTFAYLIRFPLMTAAVLVVLPFVAFFTGASALLENLFDLGPGDIFLVTMTALLSAWSVMVTARLALIYCSERFDVSRAKIGLQLKWRSILLYGLLSLPVIAGIYYEIAKLWNYTPQCQNWWKVFAVAPGIGIAFLLMWVADLLQRLLNSPSTNRKAPDLLMPTDRPFSGQLIQKMSEARPVIMAPNRLAVRMKSIPPFFGRGYIDYEAGEEDRFPMLPGHGIAISMMSIFLTVYVVVGIITSPVLTSLRAPSLAGLLFLLTMLNWGLSGMAFFFDRYRIPVLTSIAFLLGAISLAFPRADAYYMIYPQAQTDSSGAVSQQLMAQREQAKIILVAANGGGIQASAWTAQVLTGLERACRASSDCGGRSFARSVRLISAVSGGSVGAMYFANAYGKYGADEGELPADDKLKEIVRLAGRSSLDGVAWGLVYPDFLRVLLPFFSELPFFWRTDRGRALEIEWRSGADLRARLGDWRADAAAGKRPATVFNATIVDSGRPLLFSTVDHDQYLGVAKSFEKLYPGYDVPVTSAVRLSATFPFVTPAARAHRDGQSDLSQPEYHVVDGGYYDNYGMATLVEWLDKQLERSGDAISEVMVIRIHSMPVGMERSPGDSRGFFFQSTVPVIALDNVRGAGQLSHSKVEFELLQKRWRERASHKVEITLATFEYPNDDAPLSWHLTEKQKHAIEVAWREKYASDPNGEFVKVKVFLGK
jgi:hypothetical protein